MVEIFFYDEIFFVEIFREVDTLTDKLDFLLVKF